MINIFIIMVLGHLVEDFVSHTGASHTLGEGAGGMKYYLHLTGRGTEALIRSDSAPAAAHSGGQIWSDNFRPPHSLQHCLFLDPGGFFWGLLSLSTGLQMYLTDNRSEWTRKERARTYLGSSSVL